MSGMDWPALGAIGTATQAGIVGLTLPVIVGQLMVTRRVHAEEIIERGNHSSIELRRLLQRLVLHVALERPWTSEEMAELRDVVLRAEAQFLALEAEVRLRGRRAASNSGSAFLRDIDNLRKVIGYAIEALKERGKKLESDADKFEEHFLKEMDASDEDAASLRAAAKLQDGNERYNALIDVIATKAATKRGIPAAKILDMNSSKDTDVRASYRPDSHFARSGGDIENRRILGYWLDELDALVSQMSDLGTKLSALRIPKLDVGVH